MQRLHVVPVTFRQAKAFITSNHRHHTPPRGWKFAVGAADNHGNLVAIVTAGRPVARWLDNRHTLEVRRCCNDGTRNACSFLYGAARRIAKAMGYHRVITYTLPVEGGASLRVAGWKLVATTAGGSWPRLHHHPTSPKSRWECSLK
ncbi:MAG: hypothetical protein HY000_03775 [Planctomycetes bacterium]|nr:hypothetical protein [Planctomycetota bacterium]